LGDVAPKHHDIGEPDVKGGMEMAYKGETSRKGKKQDIMAMFERMIEE
jgi:hypothetical protein